MIVLDKIKAFSNGMENGMEYLGSKPEAKGAEKKAEPPETKVAEEPEKKGDESSSK